jgi:hypothetical protein
MRNRQKGAEYGQQTKEAIIQDHKRLVDLQNTIATAHILSRARNCGLPKGEKLKAETLKTEIGSIWSVGRVTPPTVLAHRRGRCALESCDRYL